MPEIVYYVAASLDGFIASPDGGVEWLTPYEARPDAAQAYASFYRTVDGLLMGRRTYEQVRQYGDWPYPGKPCWVFSRSSLDAAPGEVVVTGQPPSQVVAELEARGLGRVWLVGGGHLAASFQRDGLISEYIVTVVPVLLGSGIPLFAPGASMERLRLVASCTYASGLVELRYRRHPDT